VQPPHEARKNTNNGVKDDYNNQIKAAQQVIADLNSKSNEELEKLRRRFQPKVKEQKEIVDTNKYQSDQNKIKLEEVGVRLTDWKTKAATEQKAELEIIDNAITKLSEEKASAEEQVQKVEGSITKLIDAKKKEKEGKIKIEQQKISLYYCLKTKTCQLFAYIPCIIAGRKTLVFMPLILRH